MTRIGSQLVWVMGPWAGLGHGTHKEICRGGGGGFGRVCLSRDDGFGLLTGDKTSNSIQGA